MVGVVFAFAKKICGGFIKSKSNTQIYIFKKIKNLALLKCTVGKPLSRTGLLTSLPSCRVHHPSDNVICETLVCLFLHHISSSFILNAL